MILKLINFVLCRWDLAAAEGLPDSMKICLRCLFEVTNEICYHIYQKHGWNPIHFLHKEVWFYINLSFCLVKLTSLVTSKVLRVYLGYLDTHLIPLFFNIMLKTKETLLIKISLTKFIT